MCGYNATAGTQSKQISSPGYSGLFLQSSYMKDLDCVWWLIARPGFQVQFVMEFFSTERLYDVVTVTMCVW